MDRRERREKERELQKREEKVRKQEEKARSEASSKSRLQRIGHAIVRNIIWLIGAGFVLLGGYAVARPNVSVDPDLLLNPGDPFSTQFSIKNENAIFDAKDIQPSCRTIHVVTSHNVGMFGLPPRPSALIPVLGAGQKTTINCPSWIGGLGAGTGNVLAAYIEIDISYRQDGWPSGKMQQFPFKGLIDSQNGVHWTHLTVPELIADLSKL